MDLQEVKAMVERLSDVEQLELLAWMEQKDEFQGGEIALSMSREELNVAIRTGLDQLQRGEKISGDEAHEKLRQKSILHSPSPS